MYAPQAINPRNWATIDGSSGRRPTPAAGSSPMHSAATVDVQQLQLMLDAYYAEQAQLLALASASGGGAVSAGAVPASPVAAAGWGAAQGRSLPAYPRGTSAPGAQVLWYVAASITLA
jgi:hypothetical protein